jgi:hypothetical protein
MPGGVGGAGASPAPTRFCERRGVRLPPATHLPASPPDPFYGWGPKTAISSVTCGGFVAPSSPTTALACTSASVQQLFRDGFVRQPPSSSGVGGHLPIIRATALGKQLSCFGVVWILPAERTTPSSAIATSQNSRCTSTRSPSQASSPRPPPVVDIAGDARGKRQRRIRALSATGKSQWRPPKQARAPSPSSKTACPTTFSQKAPIPVARPYGRPRTDLPRASFMPRSACWWALVQLARRSCFCRNGATPAVLSSS